MCLNIQRQYRKKYNKSNFSKLVIEKFLDDTKKWITLDDDIQRRIKVKKRNKINVWR